MLSSLRVWIWEEGAEFLVFRVGEAICSVFTLEWVEVALSKCMELGTCAGANEG